MGKNQIASTPGGIPQIPVVPARPSPTPGQMSPSIPAPLCGMRGERERVQHHLMHLLSLGSEGSACHLNLLVQSFKN